MVQKLAWWCLYESKHVATFMIDNKITCVLTEPTLRIFSDNTSGWLQLKFKKNYVTSLIGIYSSRHFLGNENSSQ